MSAIRRAPGGTSQPSRLRDERGMLLVITMIILLVVSTLAAANLVNGLLQRSIARNQNNATIALNAADGGIQQALAWLNDDTNLPTIPTVGNPWTRPGDPVTRSNLAGGGGYTLRLSFKADTEDLDCDGDTTDIIFYNKGGTSAACPHDGLFPFPSAIFTGVPGDTGYPVITINSKGFLGQSATSNRGYREIEMDVARNMFLAQVAGAFTARAGVTATGSSFTDGRNHDINGNLGGSCGSDLPGITYDAGVAPTETCPNANIVGNPCVANHDPTGPLGPIQKTPWGVLGISQSDFSAMFTEQTGTELLMTECSPKQQYVWFSGQNTENGSVVSYNTSAPCSNYSGILVIHNEGFDPDEWEARCPVGSTDSYCTEDADGDGNRDHAPAIFNMNGNVTWTGIVIADQVVRVNGTPTIRGGVISLASGGVIESDITGNITIQYSCEAVTGAVTQGYKTRLGWHRIH